MLGLRGQLIFKIYFLPVRVELDNVFSQQDRSKKKLFLSRKEHSPLFNKGKFLNCPTNFDKILVFIAFFTIFSLS